MHIDVIKLSEANLPRMCPWQLCHLYVARWELTLVAAAVKRPRRAAAVCLQNVLQHSFNTNTSRQENRKLTGE